MSLAKGAMKRIPSNEPKRSRGSTTSAAPNGVNANTVAGLRQAATRCKACDLWKNATQTVFCEGAPNPRIMFVGEQPGDQEDRAGHPFVGPAGKLLNEALAEAGIDRTEVYVTNVVKHFRWTPSERGTRRIHKKLATRKSRRAAPGLMPNYES